MYTPLEYLEFNMDTKNDGLESLENVSPFEYICAVLGIYVRFAGRCKPSTKTNIAVEIHLVLEVHLQILDFPLLC